MFRRFTTLGLLLLVFVSSAFASRIYVRLGDPVYGFLDRMATAGVIRDLRNNTLPLQRGTAPVPEGEPGYYPVGNDPDQNYNDRNRALDDATPWLLGEVVTYRDVSVFWEYQLSNVLELRLGYEVADRTGAWDQYLSVQVRFDY